MRALALCLAFASASMAQDAPIAPPRSGPHPRLARHQERLAKALDLTDAQRTQIKTIRAHHKDALQAKRAAAQDAHQSLAKALRDPKATEAGLRELHAHASDLRFDLLLEMRTLRAEVRAILTPEQREKAAEFHGRAAERMRMLRGLGFAG